MRDSDVIVTALKKVVKAFEDTNHIDSIRQRREEIKGLQPSKDMALA